MSKGLLRSIMGRSVEALGVSVNETGTQLVDHFPTGSENEYADGRLPFSCMLTNVSVVWKTSP